MTTNVPPEYTKAELRYRSTSNLDEKLEALKEMMVLVPKHKGTERLRVDLKKRLSKLQEEIQKKPKQTKVSTQAWEHIERAGAGQVVLVGLPNCGKSSLLAAVTHAKPEIADFPFSTFTPTVGMMTFEDVQIQLIDLPPFSEFAEPWVYNLVRQADIVAMLIDLSQPAPEDSVMEGLDYLEKANIKVVGPKNFDKSFPGPGVMRKGQIIATKADAPAPEPTEALKTLQEMYGEEYPIVAVSTHELEKLNGMRRALFEILDVVRVYSKKPGQPASKEAPYILPRGSTMLDVAKAIHHDLAESLKFARIWGSAEFQGQRVERDHVVQDGDIIEVHS
ncbi:TGS domain-containing protein [Candidatus Acetothermia bacterium]|nr:TGS domain-containing protein [Candidatus Acetothermia bacterium]MBI3642772.1 TGS domain-containing protein [Candidatus Acetothermia bacterium]